MEIAGTASADGAFTGDLDALVHGCCGTLVIVVSVGPSYVPALTESGGHVQQANAAA